MAVTLTNISIVALITLAMAVYYRSVVSILRVTLHVTHTIDPYLDYSSTTEMTLALNFSILRAYSNVTLH